MTASTAAHVPPALITHCVASIRGRQHGDISVCHARTADARIAITFGGVLMVIYNCGAQGLLEAFAAARAAMAQVLRNVPAPAGPTPYEPCARTTLAIEWTCRPTYCVVSQSGRNKLNTAVVRWVDLHCGPITFQLRDQLGLISTLALLARTHKTAVAVFLDGPQHADDPTRDDYRWPQ